MPRDAKRLTDKAIQNLKPLQTQRLPLSYPVGGDSPGLYIQVAPQGGKSWLLRVTTGRKPHPAKPGAFAQIRREFGLGSYHELTLKEAREKATELRRQVARGLDPVMERRRLQSEAMAARAKLKTFAECERAALETKGPSFKTGKTAGQWRTCFDTYVNPILGDRFVGEITSEEVAAVLEPMWRTKYPTAKKVRQWIKAVFDYAKAKKYRIGDNPAEWKGCLEPLLGKPSHRVKHYPSLPYPRTAEFISALNARGGDSARALEFAILTAARSDEVRSAPWSEFDLEKKLWSIPAERMKGDRAHQVPLSDAAVDLLKKQKLAGRKNYPFVNTKGESLSDMALSKLVKDMHAASIKAGGVGYLDPNYGEVAVPHGWRSSFKDWARNETQFADEVSELALAHVNNDATRAAYARDELLSLRASLMSDWAKFCGTH
jgi:integrase